MAGERDVVDIDDAADKSEAENGRITAIRKTLRTWASHIRALRPPCLALLR